MQAQILELLDEAESITLLQFQLFEWMADYYLCSIGEVLHAALPAGLKLSSESMVQLHPFFDEETTSFDFSEKERICKMPIAFFLFTLFLLRES